MGPTRCNHVAGGGEGPRGRIVQLGAGRRTVAAGDQDLAVEEQGCSVPSPRTGHAASRGECFPGLRRRDGGLAGHGYQEEKKCFEERPNSIASRFLQTRCSFERYLNTRRNLLSWLGSMSE